MTCRRRVNSALRNAGKCDNLSFLRVILWQMDKVLGGTNGYALLLEGGNPGPSREMVFDPQQRFIRQSSLFESALGVLRSRHRGQL